MSRSVMNFVTLSSLLFKPFVLNWRIFFVFVIILLGCSKTAWLRAFAFLLIGFCFVVAWFVGGAFVLSHQVHLLEKVAVPFHGWQFCTFQIYLEKQAFPLSGVPPVTRTLSFVLLKSLFASLSHLQSHYGEKHTPAVILQRHRTPAHRKWQSYSKTTFETLSFRLGVGRSSIASSSSIDYEENCLAGDNPPGQFLFGLK